MRKFLLYKHLYAERSAIYDEAKKLGGKLGIGEGLKGRIGLTGSHSSFPGPIADDVMAEMAKAQHTYESLPRSVDRLREVVKDYYGDDYDAAPIGSGEAALWTLFDTLMTPPSTGRGDAYRCRYIAPFERHVSHQAGFGRPFPPRYKYVSAERYITAGELGVEGKRLAGLDTVLVPLAGARYETHGIKYYPAPLLSGVDGKGSVERFATAADNNAAMLSGFASLGYDTPGYGYGQKSKDGVPELQAGISRLAKEYDVPYITDDAWGMPFIGTDIRKTGASAILFSVDKVMRGPLSALIVGTDEIMVPVRRALATHSHRFGDPAAYAKAMLSAFDAGREAIVAQTFILKKILEDPNRYRKVVDETFRVVAEEFQSFKHYDQYREGITLTKTYNNYGVEVNYDRTWMEGKTGIPIFTEEDSFSGTALIEGGLAAAGVLPTITYDGNILISPGQGTLTEAGELSEEKMRLAVRALVGVLDIVCDHSAAAG